MENNPEIYFVPPKRGSEWGQWVYKEGAYYDTTLGPAVTDACLETSAGV